MSDRHRRAANPKRKCRICESEDGPWTREDAYPEWLRRRIHEWLRSLPPGVVEAGWEQRSRVLLKPVCERCQRRLNVVFEVPAHDLLREMMDGAVIPLSPAQQVLVAGWTVKTALVLILERERENPQAAQLLRELLGHMLEHGTPPSSATVRIAYLTDSVEEPGSGFLPPGWPKVLDPIRTVESVISVPGLIGETLIGPTPIIRSYIDATKDDDRFIVVWPPHVTSQGWPPVVSLSMPDSEALREAWNHKEWYGNFPGLTADAPDGGA